MLTKMPFLRLGVNGNRKDKWQYENTPVLQSIIFNVKFLKILHRFIMPV